MDIITSTSAIYNFTSKTLLSFNVLFLVAAMLGPFIYKLITDSESVIASHSSDTPDYDGVWLESEDADFIQAVSGFLSELTTFLCAAASIIATLTNLIRRYAFNTRLNIRYNNTVLICIILGLLISGFTPKFLPDSYLALAAIVYRLIVLVCFTFAFFWRIPAAMRH